MMFYYNCLHMCNGRTLVLVFGVLRMHVVLLKCFDGALEIVSWFITLTKLMKLL